MGTVEPRVVRELKPWESLQTVRDGTRNWLVRQRRRWLPYLVWWGDEVDVVVTLKEQRLRDGATPEEAIRAVGSGEFASIEDRLDILGIEFDTGLGPEGRDWEWDWSLRGPISVKFKGRATAPERRA